MSVRKIEVSYGRTVQPREYESKSASATIGVDLEDGDADVRLNLEAAMQQAMEVVLKAVGKIKPHDAPVVEDDEAQLPPDPEEKLTPAQKAARTRAEKKAAKEAAAAAAEDVDADGADDAEDEYSNSDLQKFLNAKVKELQGRDDKDAVKKIKAAVAAFAPADHEGPFTAADLNLKQRRKLVSKLEAM